MKKSDVDLSEAFAALQELREDNTVPRNVKSKIEEVQKILQANTDISIRVNKALNELEEISNDTNMQPYTRTQVWNVISLLEKA
jgi:uncharacterized protein (UPF0147 family)